VICLTLRMIIKFGQCYMWKC